MGNTIFASEVPRRRKADHLDTKRHLWFKWLSPEAKRKAIKKRLRKLARQNQAKRTHDAVPKVNRKRRNKRNRTMRENVHSHSTVPKYVYGNKTIVSSSGYPNPASPDYKPSGKEVMTYALVIDNASQLFSWSSVNGNHRSPNPHSFRKGEYTNYSGFTRTVDIYGNGTYVSGSDIEGSSPSVVGISYDATVYNNALGDLYDKIRGGVDLSVDFAEAHQAKAMMSKTVRGMKNLATTFAKMRRSNPKDWGNLWLEFTYGWKPLASSIYGTGKRIMTELSNGSDRFMEVSGSSSIRDGYKLRYGNGSTTDAGVQNIVTSNRCKIHARFRFAQSRLDTLAGFTSLNPVSIAWELTPYSFVVDWFVNVSGYLRNYESSLLYGTDFLDGYVSEGWQSLNTETKSRSSKSANAPYSQFTKAVKGSAKEVGFRRTVLGGIPKPRAPRFDPKLGTSRLVSAAALMGQFVDVLGHQRSKMTIPPRLTAADKALAAPKGMATGPFAWFFR